MPLEKDGGWSGKCSEKQISEESSHYMTGCRKRIVLTGKNQNAQLEKRLNILKYSREGQWVPESTVEGVQGMGRYSSDDHIALEGG
jgi:hypothetical protein